MLGLCFIIVGAIIQCASQNYAMLVVSRFILGFASPVSQSISPILIAELAYPTHRGKVTTMCNSVYFMGSTIAAWLVFGCGFMQSNWSWRMPALFQAFTPLVQLSLIWLVPESPRYVNSYGSPYPLTHHQVIIAYLPCLRWLLANGREEEATAILTKLHSPPGNTNPELVAREIEEIKDYLEKEKEVEQGHGISSWLQLVQTPGNRRRSLIAVIVGCGTQLNGVLLINYYLTLVLNTVGITSTREQTVINGGLQTWKWMSSILGAMLVDRMGRRSLYLFSTLGRCSL